MYDEYLFFTYDYIMFFLSFVIFLTLKFCFVSFLSSKW